MPRKNAYPIRCGKKDTARVERMLKLLSTARELSYNSKGLVASLRLVLFRR